VLSGPLSLRTSTPVTLSSPIHVSTPVKQVNGQKVKGGLSSPISEASSHVAAVADAIQAALPLIPQLVNAILG
jgi:hypothetical protein